MGISGFSGDLLRSLAGKYSRWVQEILHDDGLFMGLHNAVCVPSPPSLPLLVSRVLTVFRYLLFASVFITIKSVEAEAHDGKFTFGKLFTNEIFFTLIVSLLSTYVLWIFISLVFLDPWHIVTSVAHPSTHRLCNVF